MNRGTKRAPSSHENTLFPYRHRTFRRRRARRLSHMHGRSTRSEPRSRMPLLVAATRRRTTPLPLKINFVLRRSAASEMTPAEIVKCNRLLLGCFDSSVDVVKLAPDDVCVLGMLGTRVVSFMCVRNRDRDRGGAGIASAATYAIHTVCTDKQYRGRGLLRRMFHYVATLPQFKDSEFWLEASNIAEPANGLNQTARFKIYSKVGFTIPVGTEIRPSGEIVANVRTLRSKNSGFMYQLRSATHDHTRWVMASDMVIDACYVNSQHQSNGCIMISNSTAMREFNSK